MLWYIQQTGFSGLWSRSKAGMWITPVVVLVSEIVFFVIYYVLLGHIHGLDFETTLSYVADNLVALGLSIPIGLLLGIIIYYFKLQRTKRASPLLVSTGWTRNETWKTLGLSLYIIPAATLAVLIILNWAWLEYVTRGIIGFIVAILVLGLFSLGRSPQKKRKKW